MFDPLPTGPRLLAPSKVPAAEPTSARAAGFAGFLAALEGAVRMPPALPDAAKQAGMNEAGDVVSEDLPEAVSVDETAMHERRPAMRQAKMEQVIPSFPQGSVVENPASPMSSGREAGGAEKSPPPPLTKLDCAPNLTGEVDMMEGSAPQMVCRDKMTRDVAITSEVLSADHPDLVVRIGAQGLSQLDAYEGALVPTHPEPRPATEERIAPALVAAPGPEAKTWASDDVEIPARAAVALPADEGMGQEPEWERLVAKASSLETPPAQPLPSAMGVASRADWSRPSEAILDIAGRRQSAARRADEPVPVTQAPAVTLTKNAQDAPPVSHAVRDSDGIRGMEDSVVSIADPVVSGAGEEGADPSPRDVVFDPLPRVEGVMPLAATRIPTDGAGRAIPDVDAPSSPEARPVAPAEDLGLPPSITAKTLATGSSENPARQNDQKLSASPRSGISESGDWPARPVQPVRFNSVAIGAQPSGNSVTAVSKREAPRTTIPMSGTTNEASTSSETLTPSSGAAERPGFVLGALRAERVVTTDPVGAKQVKSESTLTLRSDRTGETAVPPVTNAKPSEAPPFEEPLTRVRLTPLETRDGRGVLQNSAEGQAVRTSPAPASRGEWHALPSSEVSEPLRVDGAPSEGTPSMLPERPFGMAPTEMRQAEAPTAPRPVPQQLAAAVTGAADGRVEIRLDPEELGRVVLQMQSDGDRISLTITTERAETSDLLRRHLQELAQEFRALGYRSVDLGFGGGDGARSGAGRGQATPAALPTDASDDVPPQSVSEPAPGGAGLDLRL